MMDDVSSTTIHRKNDKAGEVNLNSNDNVHELSDDKDNGFISSFRKFYISLSDKWRVFVVRTITTLLMIGSFLLVIYLGPIALVVMVMLIQLKFFHEVINIAYSMNKYRGLILFRSLSWYFLFSSNYFLFGEVMIGNFRILLAKEDFLQSFITHHRFISFCLYLVGFVIFVLILAKKHYIKQFTLFGWTHLILLIIITTSHFMINNIFLGIIWFMLPISLITFNDIMAYIFGNFFGKTPLIQLSPKKTWEGFIGAAIATVICSIIMPIILIQFDYFVCPLEYDDVKGAMSMECIRNPVFRTELLELPKNIVSVLPFSSIPYYPFLKHSIVMGLFASVVSPFGGFFASGFKRAFKIKDFSDVIPGHGGIVDRIDCQILMAFFVHLYYNSFIRTPGSSSVLQQIISLSRDEQLDLYRSLSEILVKRGLLAP